jgi:hypothetical protein
MSPSPGKAEALLSLAALREAGAHRVDPVRFRYLEILSQRVDGLQGEVRALLHGRLQQALADYASRFSQMPQDVADDKSVQRRRAVPASGTTVRPLAALNRYLQECTQDTSDGGMRDVESDGEMKSVRRFRQTWSRIAAEDQVEQATERGPVNAGPLNSHMLVLRSLALMRGLSPDYLQHFLAHADALLWLEQAQQKKAPPANKLARRTSDRRLRKN